MSKLPYCPLIGIDPGVNTGVAIYDSMAAKLLSVRTLKAYEAIVTVSSMGKGCYVRIEDARLRTWFGKADRERLQGAGSIKRDCQFWEEMLIHHQIPHEFVAPKRNKTKMNASTFNRMTGWDKPTNEHGRDAAMLVFGF